MQEGEPLFTLGGEYAAGAVRAAGAPFGDKHGQALAHGGGDAVAQPLTVRARVKVAGVHQVRALDRVIRRIEQILAPGARADEDNALRRVGADGLHHGFGVRLDVVLPADRTVRLVADFVQNRRIAAVFGGNLAEKRLSLAQMGFRVAVRQNMPVDNNVHVVRNRGVHRGKRGLLERWIAEIAAFAGVHGNAEQIRAVGGSICDRLPICVLREPLNAVAAHAVQLDVLAVLVAQLRAFDLQPAVRRDAACARNRGFRLRRNRRFRGRFAAQIERALDDRAGFGAGKAAQRVERARVIALGDAAGVGGEHTIVIPSVQRRKVADFSGFGVIIAGFVGEKCAHERTHRHLTGNRLVVGFAGGRQLVPVVPAGVERSLQRAGGPMGGGSGRGLQVAAARDNENKFGGRNGGIGPKRAVRIPFQQVLLGHGGNGADVPRGSGHIRERTGVQDTEREHERQTEDVLQAFHRRGPPLCIVFCCFNHSITGRKTQAAAQNMHKYG